MALSTMHREQPLESFIKKGPNMLPNKSSDSWKSSYNQESTASQTVGAKFMKDLKGMSVHINLTYE